MKKSVKNETARKIGLVYAISILIGTVIGVGIFLKNGNVFKQNDFNAIGILVSWIIAAIISLCAAWSFGEIGSASADHGGLASWVSKLVSNKFGRFIGLIQPFFYYSIIAIAISIFAAETFFKIIPGTEDIHMAAIFGLGAFLYISFLTLNFLSLNVSKKLQFALSFLKIVPIMIVFVVGLMTLINDPTKSLFDSNAVVTPNLQQPSETTTPGSFSFTSVIISLPAILFAFDSFTGVGNLSLDMNKPKKNVPLTIIIGMTLVVVIYLLITVSLIFTGQGNALNIFGNEKVLSANAQNALEIVFSIFMFVSIIGVLNGFAPIIIRSLSSVIEMNYLFKARSFENFVNHKLIKNPRWELKTGYVLSLLCFLGFFLIIGIPSLIINTDGYVDGFSNFPTTLFFGIYGVAILFGLINRKTNKVPVNKMVGFYVSAPIAIIGCFFVLGFQTLYTFSFRNLYEAHDNANWGLFYDRTTIEVWQASIFYFVYLLVVVLFYFINEWLKKKFEPTETNELNHDIHISLDPLVLDIDETNATPSSIQTKFHVLQHARWMLSTIKQQYLFKRGAYD